MTRAAKTAASAKPIATRSFVSAPDLASAPALFFLDGQYAFRDLDASGEVRFRFLAPAAVRNAFRAERLDTGWIPSGLVRCGLSEGGEFAVTFAPPRHYTLGLLMGGVVRPVRVPLPALVFAAVMGEYRVWAVRGDAFSPRARLYYPPLPNVFDTGGVCWGQVSRPVPSAATVGLALELFLASTFTSNETRAGRSKAHPRDVFQQLVEVATRKDLKRYPEDDLVEFGARSLDTELEALLGARR